MFPKIMVIYPYQDFYYKEISFSDSLSSIRNSVNSQSIISDNKEGDLRQSFPMDGKRDRIKRNSEKIIEPNNEYDKYIFEQITENKSKIIYFKN